MSLNHLPEQEQIRRNSLEKINSMKIDPYPAKAFQVNAFSDIVENKLDTRKELYQKLKIMGKENIIEILNNQKQTLLENKFEEEDINKVDKIIKKLFEIIHFDDITTSENTLRFFEIINKIRELSNQNTNKIFKSLLENHETKRDQELISLIKSRTYHSFKYLEEITIAGRIMSKRIMGKVSFAEIQDSKGKIQIYVCRDDICSGKDNDYYNIFYKKLLDIGDIIGVKGYVFKTKMGETTIHVKKLELLCKSLRPLPIVKEKDGKTWDAFTDPEMRYRQRYVDLIVNPDVKEIFRKRTMLIQSMRELFNSRGYIEVETPILQPIPGGAAARPFITHHNSLDIPLYLRIANELYLKRLIVGGYEGVYEFSKDFRNEGMDRVHNPEFTVMEIYVAYKDYNWMMGFVEKMFEKVALDLHGKTNIPYGDIEIEFKPPYTKVTMLDAIKEYTSCNISGKSEDQIRKICNKLHIEHDPSMGKGKLIDEIFSKKCEPHYINPTFITDYPIEMSPLVKKHRDNPDLTERFELIINGKEMCNAYSELNDPIDQLERFQYQQKLSEKGDDEAMYIDMDFVRALEYGMPPTSGLGIGIDRLAMLMTNSNSIQDVIFFPQMKPENKDQVDSDEKFMKLGVPKNWIESLKALGYTTVTKLKEVEKSGKLANDLNEFNKKNKPGLKKLSSQDIEEWLKKL